MYSKILLALDGSDESNQAIPHAASLASSTGAPVVVLEVIDSEAQVIMQTAGGAVQPLGAATVSAELAHEAVDAQRGQAQANVARAQAALTAQGVADVTVEVREGAPGAVIVDAAQELGCDVIVMATHGRSGFKRAILGSVADHVTRHAHHAAVLLVRVNGE